MELHDVSYGIEYVARPLMLFFSSENQLLWFSYQEYDLAHLKLGFLGVGTTLDIFQNIILIPYLEYGVLSPLDTTYFALSFCGLWLLMSDQLNMLCRNRRAHARTARLMVTEARFSREAWAEIAGLRAADRTRQAQLTEALTLMRTLQTHVTTL
ncbi:hypothetical protein Tco_1538637 [Tanacetum coccineum]